MPRVLSLKLLGPFQVEDPAGLKFLTRKVEALVAFLALPAGRLHYRAEIADLLWGSRDEGHARHSLRQALSSLRQVLARADIPALVFDGERVGFDPAAVETDVARLSAALADGSPETLARLRELWGGELLAGLDVKEEAFEEWLRHRRSSVREGALDGFLRLLGQQLREGPTASAVETARAVLALDPTHEATHRCLMDLYVARNQRNLALRQYRECEATLRREFDIAPNAETRRLYEQLLRGTPAPAAGQASSTASRPAAAARGNAGPPTIELRKFATAGADPTESAIADILSEDVLAAMSRDRSTTVVEQTLAADKTPLAPAYVLEGTIRRVGDQARVTTHLIDTATTTCLWSEQNDLRHEQILNFDRSLALHLTAIFRREIESAEARKALAACGQALDPWGWYHLGLREMYRFTMKGLRAGRQHFERAIALDPDFALAFARLAYAFQQMYWYGTKDERPQFLEQGLAAARQAVGLDPKCAHGRLALGRIHAIRGEFDLAVRELETAIRLDGSFAQAHFGLGQAYAAAGDPANALAPLDRAIALDAHDPHLWTFYHDRAEACFALGRLADAERSSRIAVALPNASHFAHATLVAIMGASRKGDGTAAAVARLRQINPNYALSAAAAELGHHANQTFVGEYLAGLSRAGLAA